jgi:hypothetical protein
MAGNLGQLCTLGKADYCDVAVKATNPANPRPRLKLLEPGAFRLVFTGRFV